MNNINGKVLVIGLDGATWTLIRQGIEEGKLPTFNKLIKEGVWGDLESSIPPTSCPAWPCLYTGKRPERLGIYFFTEPKKNTYQTRIVHLNWRKWHPIWEILSGDEKKVCMVNVFSDRLPSKDSKSETVAQPI